MFLNLVAIRFSYIVPALYLLVVCILWWTTRTDPFFWDTVQLASKHAHHFYTHGLQWQPLTAEIDSGHPPVFGYYLAVVWTFFGKTLLLSHLAMLPFLLLHVWLLWQIGRQITTDKWGAFLPLLVLADPVYLGQSVMVSPDIVLITSFLAAILGVWRRQSWLIVLGTFGMCAISMRGMMTAAAVLTWAAGLPFLKDFNFRKLLTTAWPFLPGFAFAAWFLCWHWQATGWVGYHAGSPWAGAFQRVGASGVARNVAIVGWRWLDFGRVGEWGVCLGILFSLRKQLKSGIRCMTHTPLAVLPLFICLLFFLLPSAVLYQNLSAHRYFLPAYYTFHLLVFQWIVQWPVQQKKIKAWLLGGIVVCLASGNCWIYPKGVSMDWDSTLAHLPYHGLRAEALAFLEEQSIEFSQVGSAFPNLNTGENLLLNGDERKFSKLDLASNAYVLASNVFNDISLEDYTALADNWELIWQKKQAGVCMEIYRRKE